MLSHLHILDYRYYFKLTDWLIEANIKEVLQTYDEVLRLGFQSHHFLQGLMKHVRHLLVAKTATNILQMAPKMVTQYGAQAERVDVTFLCDVLDVLEQCELHYKERQDKRLHVELMLIKLARLSFVVSSRAEGEPLKPSSPSGETSQERVSETTKPQPSLQKEVPLSPPSQSSVASVPTQQKQEKEVPLRLEKVQAIWNTYMEKLKEKGAMSAYATLKSPLLLEGNTIVLQIANALQKNSLHTHAHDLLAFMRKNLGNPTLRIVTRVTSLSEKSPQDGTPATKMKHFVDKYPLVEELRTALELTTS